MSGNKFPRRLRVRGKKRIDTLFEGGSSGFCHPFRYIYRTAGGGQPQQAGNGEDTGRDAGNGQQADESGVSLLVSVSKKYHKKAVKRNLLKRRTRESFRTSTGAVRDRAETKKMHIDLALLYSTKEIHDFKAIDNAVKKILHEIAASI